MSGARNFRPASGLETIIPSARELDEFDDLPISVRRVLDEAPCCIDAVSAMRVYRREGKHAVLRKIAAIVDKHLDACEAETGVPRPNGPLVVNKRRRRRGHS